jgi:hypothetical protein
VLMQWVSVRKVLLNVYLFRKHLRAEQRLCLFSVEISPPEAPKQWVSRRQRMTIYFYIPTHARHKGLSFLLTHNARGDAKRFALAKVFAKFKL